MRGTRTAVTRVLVVCGGLLVGMADNCARAGDASVSGDLARMQGRWVTRAGERGEFAVTLEVQGDEVNVTIKTAQGLKLEARGTVRVDESVSPHALDWVGFSSADTIELPEVPAIYEFVDGGFRVCNGGPNNTRPSTFKPGAGVLAGVHRFERPAAPGLAGAAGQATRP